MNWNWLWARVCGRGRVLRHIVTSLHNQTGRQWQHINKIKTWLFEWLVFWIRQIFEAISNFHTFDSSQKNSMNLLSTALWFMLTSNRCYSISVPIKSIWFPYLVKTAAISINPKLFTIYKINPKLFAASENMHAHTLSLSYN